MSLPIAVSRYVNQINTTLKPTLGFHRFHYPVREMHRKSIYEREKVKKLRFYILDRYINYLKNYDTILESKFPKQMQTYRAFMHGFRSFFDDTKVYLKIVNLLYKPGKTFKNILRREIELYDQMPKDMRKVFPVLILSAVPFGFYVVIPLIYLFPKQMLTRHFWTLEQKQKFDLEYLHSRLSHNKPIFRHLQSQLDFLEKNKHPLHGKWSTVLGMIGSGQNPSPEQILECKNLFAEEPYNLMYLSHLHTRHLLKQHGMHLGWFRRTRLADRALILMEMDQGIIREGGVHNLPLDAMRHCCYIRGLNPVNMKTEEMITWLRNWIQISQETNKDNLSLLLHSSVLLGYNEPSNWRLIYCSK